MCTHACVDIYDCHMSPRCTKPLHQATSNGLLRLAVVRKCPTQTGDQHHVLVEVISSWNYERPSL